MYISICRCLKSIFVINIFKFFVKSEFLVFRIGVIKNVFEDYICNKDYCIYFFWDDFSS